MGSRVLSVLMALGCLSLAGCGSAGGGRFAAVIPGRDPVAGVPVAHADLPDAPSSAPAATATASASGGGSDLLHNPAETPMNERLVVPSASINAPLYAVGLTSAGAMDAPEGPAGTAVWKQAFWYRGDVLPGANGVAAIAGHVDDTLGQPGAFWDLRRVRTGDTVQVVDASGHAITFRVVDVVTYTLAQANSRPVLERLFGVDAVAGRPAGTTPDTVGRLTLITCTGTFRSGEYDHRLAVFAERVDPAPA